MNGTGYADYSGGTCGMGYGSRGPFQLRMVGMHPDNGQASGETPRSRGSRTEDDQRDVDRTLAERIKLALGIGLRARVRSVEIEVGRIKGWMEGAEARDQTMAEAIDALLANKR